MHAATFTADRPATARGPHARRDDVDARLSWLVAADAEAERRARLFRTPREEREMLMMLRPVSAERAFALFGLLLGTLPPAAIFLRLTLLFSNSPDPQFCLLFIPMLFVCALVGRQMGRVVGRTLIAGVGRRSWALTPPFALLSALVWALATGAAGGVLFFGLGAVAGVILALLVAPPAFVVFTTFHRLLARGGMIDERHLRPLAWAVAATAAAAIAGL